MKLEESENETQAAKRRMKLRLVIVGHVLIALIFFAAAILWGKFV